MKGESSNARNKRIQALYRQLRDLRIKSTDHTSCDALAEYSLQKQIAKVEQDLKEAKKAVE